jgi:hypothetical protein
VIARLNDEGEELIVIGRFHTARDPSSWQERLDALPD